MPLMRLKVVPISVECSLHALQACARFVPIPPFSSTNSKMDGRDRTVPLIALSHPLLFKTPLKSQNLYKKVCKDRNIQCSFSSFEGMYDEELSYHVEGLAKSFGLSESEGGYMDRLPLAISKTKGDQDSFLNLRFDLLEPMMLGISPEVPDWPGRETALRATIEQKAKCFGIPLSLRMIKKKLQCEGGFTDCKDSDYCSVKAAFSSMVFIIVELQSYALHMRESLCHEDLDIAIAKVQKEMHSSFAWLFQQVFSKTPSLMIHVMILLANFGVFSASQTGIMQSGAFPYDKGVDLSVLSSSISQIGDGVVNGNEATKMLESIFAGEVLDHETIQSFVSPVSVEVESDGYEEYHRTDLLYQMNLSREPNNPLLLCNYGQFLQLVAHDYDRAEECYKRATQVLPPDAEAVIQYANFLWMVRRDLCEAEERFLQALAVEPDNSYYASRYANFLWSTGGEETCFPVSDLPNPNL